MEALSWSQLNDWVTPDDGVLPDGLVLGVSPDDWQRLLDLVHANSWGLWWRWGRDEEPVPFSAAQLLDHGSGATLALSVGAGVQVNVHNPGADLDFDFDLRELSGQDQVDALTDFIRRLGRLLGRPVILRYEGSDRAFAIYDPGTDAFCDATQAASTE